MREASLVLSVLIVSSGAAAAAYATSPPDHAAWVEAALEALTRGESPTLSRVVEVGSGGAVERAATAEESRALLEDARAALARGGPAARGPGALVTDVGFGAVGLPVPHDGCDPVFTRLISISAWEPVSMVTYRVGSEGVFGTTCGPTHGPLLEALLDARPALESCDACAEARAQLWEKAPPGFTHVNDFAQAQHRGYGRVTDSATCGFGWCVNRAIFRGMAASVELLATPVDLPVPPTQFP